MSITSTLNSLHKNKFLVLGRAGLDLYADPPGILIEFATKFEAALGGSAANIAVAISKLGGETALISAVSDDAVGRYTLQQLKNYCVTSDYVSTVKGEARNSLAVVETRIENCQSVIYRNGAADFQLDNNVIEKINFKTYGALIVTGTALAQEPSRSATKLAMKTARDAGLCLIMDVDYRPYSWASADEASATCLSAAEACDIVIGNDVEFDVMANGNKGRELAAAMAKLGDRLIVYKMGEKGAVTFSKNEAVETPIFKVDALKPTGAGDAFMGGFITSLANKCETAEAVRRGAAAAAIVVSRVGCAPAMSNKIELDQFIAQHTAKV